MNTDNNSNKISIKKILAILAIIILLMALVIIIVIKVSSGEKLDASKKLNEYGELFYKYYYSENKSVDKEITKKMFSEWKDTGITIKLRDLKIYLDNHKVEDYSVFKTCDTEKTKVTVYPVSPYGENDYKVKSELICE